MTLPAAFLAKVRASDCETWVGAQNTVGYGVLQVNGVEYLAHRFRWEAERGPIPDGMTLDHLCRTRNCVRLSHLEVVTHAENGRRGRRAASLAVGDTCSNGHRIGPGDLYERPSGKTECHVCRRASSHRPGGRRRPSQQRSAASVMARLAPTP